MASIEFLILANHAENQNGLLYASGIGVEGIDRPIQPNSSEPGISHFGIGLSVLVPWEDTNNTYPINIKIESADEEETLIGSVDGQVEMGRPAGIQKGDEQRAVVGVNSDVVFPREGKYRIVAQLGENGEEGTSQVNFRVRDSQ